MAARQVVNGSDPNFVAQQVAVNLTRISAAGSLKPVSGGLRPKVEKPLGK